MMAPIRVAGTRRAIARALADMPSGLRNSSLKISPGWVVTRPGVATPAALAFLVVVDDFDIGGPTLVHVKPIRAGLTKRSRCRAAERNSTGFPRLSAARTHGDFDVLIECREHSHQPFDRESLVVAT